jgi:hypothetical protein
VFIERLWRSLKQEHMYLKSYTGIASWIAFYTSRRLHQALVHRTPVAVWRDGGPMRLGAQAMDMTLHFDNARVGRPTASTAAADSIYRSVISGDRSSRTPN